MAQRVSALPEARADAPHRSGGVECLRDGRSKEFVESRDGDSGFNSGEKTSKDLSDAYLWRIRGKRAERALTYAPPQATAIVTARRIVLR